MTHATTSIAPRLIALTLAAGCSVQPGEYRVYRAAFAPEQRDADCPADPDTDDDSSTFVAVDTFVVFASDDDTYFLELAGLGLTGTRDGDDYSFRGEQVDVETSPPDADIKVTATLTLTVDLELAGEEAHGEFTRVEKRTCTGGDACDKLQLPTTCTSHGSFAGTWVKDASVDYSLPDAAMP